jgi:3-oxoacyl-[acyl-carrier protein] reductase
MSDRVAFVTGGASGIGRATALALARAGHPVALNYRSRDVQAKEVVETILDGGGTAIAVQGDVRVTGDVDRMFAEIESQLGPVHVLVNNAGTRIDGLMMLMSDDTWDEVIRTNLFGTFACARRALKPMLRSRWGRIVNVGSVVSRMGNPGQANYAAAKAGLVGMTKTLAREVAAKGITVNVVEPGLVPTDLTTNLPEERFDALVAQVPVGRAGAPEEVAAAICFLCSEDAAYVTGSVLAVDGGMTA